MDCELIQQIPSSLRIWNMRIKHTNLPHVAVWRHLTDIGAKAYYVKRTFWAQAINILSREEQDFTSQDANSHQRLTENYCLHILFFKCFTSSIYLWLSFYSTGILCLNIARTLSQPVLKQLLRNDASKRSRARARIVRYLIQRGSFESTSHKWIILL